VAVAGREEERRCLGFGRDADQRVRGCFWMGGGGAVSLSRWYGAQRVHATMMVESPLWVREDPFAGRWAGELAEGSSVLKRRQHELRRAG